VKCCLCPWKMGGYGRGTATAPVHFSIHHGYPIDLLGGLTGAGGTVKCHIMDDIKIVRYYYQDDMAR
jgi:hypothetical protein